MKSGDKTAFVTGGCRGIGRGISMALSRTGAAVALSYNTNKALAEEVVKEIAAKGGRAIALRMDVADRLSVKSAVEKVKDSLGSVDILVNNAATSQEKPFDAITDGDWDLMMAVNLRGPFVCSQEVLGDMVEAGWGRIINIASIGGQWGGFNQVHYAAAKAGLISLTMSLARIYSSRGVTTNAVAPGLVATDMAATELDSPAGREKVRGIPMGRVATIEEVAAAASFLASDEAGYITGQTINANGGMYFG
jgi:acetoacetyl-CoA reductase/3-oxoacyl-[acyl-carrier protein] reductase